MPNSNQVIIGKADNVTGAVKVAPLGTAAPTTATSALDKAFVGDHYVSEDGVTLAQDISTSSIKDWSGSTIRQTLDEFTGTVQFSFLSYDADALAALYGESNVTVTAATSKNGTQTKTAIKGELAPAKSFVFNMKDGDAAMRIYIPNGQVTERGDMTFSASEAVKLDATITAYPDADGTSIYVFSDDGQVVSA